MRAIIRAAFIAALLLPAAAFGQQRIDDYVVNLGLLPSGAAHALTLDSSNALYVDCLAGCGGGGGGGTVAQGAAGSSAWLTSDSALDALISGGKLPVSGTFWQTTQPVSIASMPTTPVSGTFWQATQPVSDATQGVIGAATAPSYMHVGGCVYTSAGVTLANGQSAATSCASDNSTFVRVNGTAATSVTAQTSGGPSWAHAINGASSAMPTSVKSSAGQVYRAAICNSNASAVYFHLFNLGAAPTVGSATGIVESDIVPAGQCQPLTWADVGGSLGTGIAYDVTSTGLSDSDSGTIATANSVAVTIWYK